MGLKPAPSSLNEHRDAWQLVTFKGENGDMDGGDTCANEFTAAYCAVQGSINYPASEALSKLWAGAVPVRHPDPAKWYSAQDRLSRDQFTPLLIFLAATGHQRLPELLKLHAKNKFMWAWNTRKNFVYPTPEEHALKSTPDVPWNYAEKRADFTGPDIWAIEIRGLLIRSLLWAPLYPALLLLDLHGLLNAAWTALKHAIKPDYDRRNLTLKTHFSAKYWPTPWSWLASKIWSPKLAQDAANKWWSQPGEPPLHTWVNLLWP